jgi:peptide deformylase
MSIVNNHINDLRGFIQEANQLPVLIDPDPRLRKVSSPVTQFDEGLCVLTATLFVTMNKENGIGLAAPQVDIQKRVIVTSVPGESPRYFINPEIIATKGSQRQKEGCLSIPGTFATIKRHKSVRIKYQNIHGDEFINEFAGLHAVCLEHEIDHLDGILFHDYLHNREMLTNVV